MIARRAGLLGDGWGLGGVAAAGFVAGPQCQSWGHLYARLRHGPHVHRSVALAWQARPAAARVQEEGGVAGTGGAADGVAIGATIAIGVMLTATGASSTMIWS